MGAGFYLEPSHPGYVKDKSMESIAEAIVAVGGVSDDNPEVCAGMIGEIGVGKDFTPARKRCCAAPRARQNAAARPCPCIFLDGCGSGIACWTSWRKKART